MADDNRNDDDDGTVDGVPASQKIISLSQALLAPLDAIFKAQIHGARSFLNLLLQMGTPHVPLDKDGKPLPSTESEKRVFQQEFIFKVKDSAGNDVEHKLSVPALALVPLSPLAIDDAQFEFDYTVSRIAEHEQLQDSRLGDNKQFDNTSRPWYLVKEPVSFRGVIAPKSDEVLKKKDSEEAVIKIKIHLTKQALPSGLDKLLTTMTEISSIKPIENVPPAEIQTPPEELPK